MKKKSIDHLWLARLRESLATQGRGNGTIIVAGKDGADYLEVSKEDIDVLLCEHQSRLQRSRKQLVWVAFTALCVVGSLTYLLTSLTARHDTLTNEHGNLRNTLGRIVHTINSASMPPVPLPTDNDEQSLESLSRLLIDTDQAFQLYVETTRNLLDHRVAQLADELNVAGVELNPLADNLPVKSATGGLMNDVDLAVIWERYLDRGIYEKLDQWARMQTFHETIPDSSPVVNAIVTSPFGLRRHPLTGKVAPHYGVDYISLEDRGVFASGSGRISFVGVNGSFGQVVVIDHGDRLQTLYAHLEDFNVEEGQFVTRGQRLGTMGDTGTSDGIHLHFEVLFDGKQLNPSNIIKSSKHTRVARNVQKKQG